MLMDPAILGYPIVASMPPAGYVMNDFDCNDDNNLLSPAQPDVADAIDNNCDGSVDEPAIEWQTSLGGTADDYAYAIAATSDGGSIIAGYSNSTDGDVSGHHGDVSFQDVWVVKLNATGSIEWEKSYGGTYNDGARAIKATGDGGYIVAGYSSSNDGDVTGHHGLTINYNDFWILKLDANGELLWQKSLGGTNEDMAYAIDLTPDGGFIVAGNSISKDGDVSFHHGMNSFHDFWVVKLDALGNIQWENSLGGTNNDWCTDVHPTPDGGYIVGGYSYSKNDDLTSNKGQGDFWIVKLDASGNIVWQKSYGGGSYEHLHSISLTSDGGYIVTGDAESADGDVLDQHGTATYDIWVLKLDGSGNIQWQKSLGGSASDFSSSVFELANGNFVIAGSAASLDGDVTVHYGSTGFVSGLDYWMIELDANGVLQWQKSYGGFYDDRTWE
jgi:hypothetical protein